MTKGLIDAKLVHCKPLPRYLRRIIHDSDRNHYQREEYLTATARNERWQALRGMTGLVKYSDMNSAGIMVYVVAWTRPTNAIDRNDDGVQAANRKTTGGRVPYPPAIKSWENGNDIGSIQLDDPNSWKSYSGMEINWNNKSNSRNHRKSKELENESVSI